MTCGGILLGLMILAGGAWLSDRFDAPWPLWVAVAIILLFIAWRVFEFVYQRHEIRRLDEAFTPDDPTFRHGEPPLGFVVHRKLSLEGPEVAFYWHEGNDGVRFWDFDPSQVESIQGRTRRVSDVIAELNTQFGVRG